MDGWMVMTRNMCWEEKTKVMNGNWSPKCITAELYNFCTLQMINIAVLWWIVDELSWPLLLLLFPGRSLKRSQVSVIVWNNVIFKLNPFSVQVLFKNLRWFTCYAGLAIVAQVDSQCVSFFGLNGDKLICLFIGDRRSMSPFIWDYMPTSGLNKLQETPHDSRMNSVVLTWNRMSET